MLFLYVLGLLAFTEAVQAAETMTFRLASTGKCGVSCPKVIAAEGEITDRTPRDFVDFVYGNLPGRHLDALVLIDSPGGKVVAAMELGKVFRRIGVAAMVARAEPPFDSGPIRFSGGSCFSACVYALMGAKKRVVPRQSKVGLHRMFAYESGADPADFTGERRRRFDNGKMAGVLQRYAAMMGVSPNLVDAAEHGSFDTARVLTPTEIAKWRLSSP